MSLKLAFDQLLLTLEPSQACWGLNKSSGEQVHRLRTGLTYHLENRQVHHSPETWQVVHEQQSPAQAEVIAAWTAPGNLDVRLRFQFVERPLPLLSWQMQITNRGRQPVAVDELELLSAGQDGMPWIEPGFSKPSFFANGWQSWSYTGTYQPHESTRRTRLGLLNEPLIDDSAVPHPRRPGHFISNMFGVLGCQQNRRGILAGFLSQQQHFGFLECTFDPLSLTAGKKTRNGTLATVLRLFAAGDGVNLAPGEQMTSDWACLQFVELDSERPLDPYLIATAKLHALDEHGRRRSLPPEISAPANGWCSWYYFYQNITAQNLQENLATAAALRQKLNLELFQIDDGFETLVGDWYKFRPGFPDGVAPLASDIRQAGFIPGLWLAPFIVQSSSALARMHPDWLLRGRQNRPVNAGFAWGNLTQALDLTHPAALDYTAETVRTAVHEWGFDYIKLDFLYAGALAGRRYDPSKTRAQVLRHALQTLRDAAGERVFLLGCGCPLGSAIGLVDVMRIGPDVDQRWQPSFAPIYKVSRRLNHALFHTESNMPSVRNAIHNVLTRLPLHQRWWINDPDCLILNEKSELTLAEVQTLATAIALSGGQLLLSDNLPGLTPERMRIAQTMMPLLPEAAVATDWFEASPPRLLRRTMHGAVGGWSLLAFFNWEDNSVTRSFQLDREVQPLDGTWLAFARDFWSNEIITLQPTAKFSIEPHGVRLFALRHVHPEQPAYLGSDLHVSQGLEVTSWRSSLETTREVQFHLQTAVSISGKIVLYLPWDPERLQISSTVKSGSLHFTSGPNRTVQVSVECGPQPIEIIIQST